MTEEEIAKIQSEIKKMQEGIECLHPTYEERLEALESAMLAILGGVV